MQASSSANGTVHAGSENPEIRLKSLFMRLVDRRLRLLRFRVLGSQPAADDINRAAFDFLEDVAHVNAQEAHKDHQRTAHQ